MELSSIYERLRIQKREVNDIGYYIIEGQVMKKLNFRKMRAPVKKVEKRFMDDYRDRIKELRQRLYQLMRMRDGKSV